MNVPISNGIDSNRQAIRSAILATAIILLSGAGTVSAPGINSEVMDGHGAVMWSDHAVDELTVDLMAIDVAQDAADLRDQMD